MRTLMLLVLLMFVASIVPFMRQAAALGGCCKERQTVQHAWYNNGKSLEDCVEYNTITDGDDVFVESGLVWWHLAC